MIIKLLNLIILHHLNKIYTQLKKKIILNNKKLLDRNNES